MCRGQRAFGGLSAALGKEGSHWEGTGQKMDTIPLCHLLGSPGSMSLEHRGIQHETDMWASSDTVISLFSKIHTAVFLFGNLALAMHIAVS